MQYTVNIYHLERELEVLLDFEYDSGIYTYPNGDPGYAPVAYTELIEIYYEGTPYLEVIKRAIKLNIINQSCLIEIEEKAVEQIPQ